LAENPLVTITRLLGGTVLMQGRLGHQILGQLLVMNTNEVAMAVATVVLAGTSGQRSAVGQIAIRTVAPALAVRALLNKQEKRIDLKREQLEELEVELDDRDRRHEVVSRRERQLEGRWLACETENARLQGELARLTTRLKSVGTTARRRKAAPPRPRKSRKR
jgi:hypothetical protein